MATIGTVLSVAHSLYSALNSPVVKAVCSTLGYKSHLEDLEKTVTTVQSVLLDAAASEELNNAARDYIEKLKAAVYDADDLFDEFRTLPERKQQLKDSKLSEKVRRFLSSENPLKVVYQMSKEIKKIGKNLDGIARDHTNFRFAIDSKHIRNRRQETSSFVFAPNVIGREADVEGIVDNLLDLNGKKGARYLTVVGIGGMGKTTLAQLVCANQRVKDWFYSNVWWVCVADQDNSQFDMKTILSKMLESVTDSNGHCNSSLEVVQKKLGQELEGKKYLLVLDDVWNKDRVKWMELTDFLTLTLGVAESRIMVTTRSHDVANAIGNSNVHVLKGLSDENSWRLFEKTAFEQKPDSQVHALEVEIGKKIVRDHTNFGFAVDSRRIRYRRQETCSYVNKPNVIGREVDVELIVGKLLDLNGKRGARFLAVVGMGGMGKTTLAQLVCDDQMVKERFSSNVWWVCVADEKNNPFDMKTILSKMLESVTRSNRHRDSSLEVVQKELGEELEGKKYLLVLDDVWNEDRVKWKELTDFLTIGAAESRILVTTRSHDVAKAIGNSDIHELKGLSDENSWSLFEATAFEQKPDSQVHALEVEIGKKIVQQCANVPLALKVVGSLLCGQGLDKWRTFETSGLGGIGKGDNDIMSILKFSYHNLDPSLKSCFTYCASFPKDHRMKKEMLIRLWMAQGYIVPFHRLQTIEDAGEEHFLILLRRCFFQDVRVNKCGNVRSFKMHDLIHDVAQQVAGQEMLIATSETINLGDKARHVFEGSCLREENFYSNVKVRSYLRNEASPFVVDLEFPLDKMFTNGECLRTLTLVNVGMKTLPDSIGKLLHLRYLDLSDNEELKTLPGSITKLHNLQTLKLRGCKELRELPKNLSRLVNLMHLNIEGCDRIECMPVGMDKLTSLCELTNFVVADESSSGDNRVGQLKDLKSLAVNLKGRIRIKMLYNSQGANLYDWEGSCFKGAEHLQAVHIDFRNGLDDCVVANDEALWEKLFPPRNVTKLKLEWYNGVNFQRWGGADYKSVAIFPNLVRIQIGFCLKLKHLPMLSKLKYLKSLGLYSLDELEYIDDETSWSSSCAALPGAESKEEAECTLFPCLESLSIWGVPKLKGMFSRNNNNDRL